MAGESKKDDGEMAGDVATASTANENKRKKQKRGILSRIQNLFTLHGDDFEKRLLYISKEEAAVLARIMKRSQYRRRITRNLIIFSVFLEVIAVGYAIMTTRSLELNWKMRALRVLPMFLLPGLSTITYSAFVSFTRICDHRDQRILERLRAERQAKIDELKEKTNYYTTQQLIQRYDPDPAAKAAAATVLASKLGADSGLKVYLGDEPKLNALTTKSHDAEQSSRLRNRKQLHMRSSSADSTVLHHSDEDMLLYSAPEVPEISKQNQLVDEHYHRTVSSAYDGGWIARIAALLVGEDPTQSYALICDKCHMHNGLARKEDFPFITYYCPHCKSLNRPKQLEEHVPGSDPPNMSSLTTMDDNNMINNVDGSMSDRPPAGSSAVSDVETTEGSEVIVSDGSVN